MTPPRLVYFTVFTHDDGSLEDVAARIAEPLGLRFTPYSGTYFDWPVLECRVLGIWVVLTPVKSLQPDAPMRYQLQGTQHPSDRAEFSNEYHVIDDYLLHVLEQHEPGRWYSPSEAERRIDAGLDAGRIQDLPAD